MKSSRNRAVAIRWKRSGRSLDEAECQATEPTAWRIAVVVGRHRVGARSGGRVNARPRRSLDRFALLWVPGLRVAADGLND